MTNPFSLTTLREQLEQMLASFLPVPERFLITVTDFLLFLGIILVAFVAHLFLRKILISLIRGAIQKTKNNWDDELIKSRLLRRLSDLFPSLFLWNVAPVIFRDEGFASICQVVFSVTLVIIGLLTLYSAINMVNRVYNRFSISNEIPLTGFSQVVKVLLAVGAGIMIISMLVGKSPALIFSGFGALTAVLMLVFKDPILGLTAGIQLSSNRILAKGDWIEMPKYGADGSVLEVALTTVKVQNWDKTITTVPTYALISEGFKNWRGMSESGLRRIKRHLVLDVNTIGFLTTEQENELSEIPLLRDYMESKRMELTSRTGQTNSALSAKRALTNIGTFRAYVVEYLKAHPQISESATLIVRQREPTENGLPLEIYAFSTDNRWVSYEGIQSDIFDHLFAILPEFGLRAFQTPSGHDFQQKFS